MDGAPRAFGGFLGDLMLEAPNLGTGSLLEWKAAVPGVEFDLTVDSGESRVVKNMNAAGLLRYLESRGESMAICFNEAGAEALFNLHRRPSAGKPKTIESGREIKLWLDEETIKAARKKGSGSVSAGIRAAFAELNAIGKLASEGFFR